MLRKSLWNLVFLLRVGFPPPHSLRSINKTSPMINEYIQLMVSTNYPPKILIHPNPSHQNHKQKNPPTTEAEGGFNLTYY